MFDPNKIISFERLMKMKFPKKKWLVDKLIPLDGIIINAGNSGSYKSWVTLLISLAVATGKPFLNEFKTTQAEVLMIEREDQKDDVYRRIRHLGYDESTLPIHLYFDDFELKDVTSRKNVNEFICKNNIKLIVINSLVRVVGEIEENNPTQINMIYDMLKDINPKNTSVLIVHHNKKCDGKSKYRYIDNADLMRGSTNILAMLDSQFTCTVRKPNEEFIVSHNKLRMDIPAKPFIVKVNKDENDKVIFSYSGVYGLSQKEMNTAKKSKIDELKPKILSLFTPDRKIISQKEIVDTFRSKDFSDSTIVKTIKTMVDIDKSLILVPKSESLKQIAFCLQ